MVEFFILFITGIIIGGLITKTTLLIFNILNIQANLTWYQIGLVGLVPLLIGMLSSVGPASVAGSKNITQLLRTDYS
jgi:ABC-type lipoprotein release transport system permease subunit